ncbi:hypothetical protein GP475_08885 [Corynebacterium poyangense]|uniref:Uncharacterized protein n=1 Tax=Corynebacterium poyangense TaxID=2684405 RepID=A0A7H0SQB6_9CORY|nr:hypothetical protein [Corynebacterium poyangense]QNQ90741.1 hypothetical protein GP475_08885 [Corynebacterium poyangense]
MNEEPIEWDKDVDRLINLGLVALNKKRVTLNQTMLEITRWGSNILQQDWEEFQERKRRK